MKPDLDKIMERIVAEIAPVRIDTLAEIRLILEKTLNKGNEMEPSKDFELELMRNSITDQDARGLDTFKVNFLKQQADNFQGICERCDLEGLVKTRELFWKSTGLLENYIF